MAGDKFDGKVIKVGEADSELIKKIAPQPSSAPSPLMLQALGES
ncbi:hypothetical protein [Achromobacter sp.]|nr:hypothetical protein [Achromobacter sp.]